MTEYFDSIAKRIANILLTLAVSFALFACADIGERDNPVDPGYKYKGTRIEIGDLTAEVESSDDLMHCTKSHYGEAAYVKEIKGLYICTEDGWIEVVKGSMTDSRDGQVYKTISIGTQTWMAENLNYETSGSYCKYDDGANCSKYGRLYEWLAAKTACPIGWHLPSDDEWMTLFDNVGGTVIAGRKLKSTKGWFDGGAGTDSFGFTVLPVHDGSETEICDMGCFASFWSSSEYGSGYAGRWNFNSSVDYVGGYWVDTKDEFYVSRWNTSVRCLSDSEVGGEAPSSSAKDPESAEGTNSTKVNWIYLNPGVDYGIITDSRDGQIYKTVTIGTQTWMAENLNYETGDSYCYRDKAANCTRYGRLYEWKTAIEACPTGWHLPDDDEWKSLWTTVGESVDLGTKLKASSGWGREGNGTDSFGFAVLPAGERDFVGYYSSEGLNTFFWSASEEFSWRFTYDGGVSYMGGVKQRDAHSVRCLRDSDEGVKDSWLYLNPDIDYGEFTDSRDGQVYKTVTIGTQTWMAENLNYSYTGESLAVGYYTLSDYTSWCYEYKNTNCKKYGRLYTWSAVMDSAAQFSENAGTKCGYGSICTPNSPHRGICPEGWHVPVANEYLILYAHTGALNSVGQLLKSTHGWNDGFNGTDKLGFSVIPAGYRDGGFTGEGYYAGLWTADGDSDYALDLGIYSGYDDIYLNNHQSPKYYGQSLRCLKDSDNSGATTPATPESSSSAVKPTSSATADESIFALELWDAAEGKAQVQTGNKKGGYWFSYTDKGDKGLSTLEWGAEVGDEYDDASMAPVIEACGGLCGNFDLKVGDNPYKPYVGFAFGYGASAKETADATKIKGICVEYTSDSEINVELGLTEAQEKKIGCANPFVAIPASASASVVDLAWGEFAQPDWVSATQKITSSAAVKELSSIKFKIAGDTDGEDGSSGSFLITKVGPMGSCE